MSMRREFKVGLFIVLTTIVIILSLLYLAYEKGYFEKVFTFTLSSKSGDGFTEGMPVVFSGFSIGKVQALELSDKGIVLISIKIPERHVKWIKKDSSFILYRPLIGASRIIVTTTNLFSPQLPDNKIPEVETVNDINDVITQVPPLIEKITVIAANLETLSKNLADPKGDLNRSLNNVAKVTENLNAQLFGKEGTLPQINIVLKDIIVKLEKLNTTVDNINKISQEASEGMKDLSTLRSDIDDTVNAIDDIVNKIDELISSKKDPVFKKP